MKCKLKILYSVFILTLVSCTSEQTINSKEVSAETLIYPILLDLSNNKNIQSTSLSQIADSISYIKLESNSKSFLSTILGIEMNDTFVYVNTMGKVHRFSKDGTFISDINNIGKGPGEGYARCFAVNPNENHVFVYNNYTGKIMQYDKNNSFNRYLKISSDGVHHIEKMFYYKKNLLLGIRSYPHIKYFTQIYNFKTDSLYVGLYNKYPLDYNINSKGIGFNTKSVFFNTYNDTLLIKETFCDTIFSTVDLKTYSPRYILNLGKNKLSYRDDLLARTRKQKNNGINIVADNFCETSRYLFIRCDITKEKDRNRQLVIYDKKKNKMFSQEDLQIENDLDGGLNFLSFGLLKCIWSYGDKVYCLLEPNDIMERTKKNNIKFADSFEKLAQNIEINDNPVLMVVSLKK